MFHCLDLHGFGLQSLWISLRTNDSLNRYGSWCAHSIQCSSIMSRIHTQATTVTRIYGRTFIEYHSAETPARKLSVAEIEGHLHSARYQNGWMRLLKTTRSKKAEAPSPHCRLYTPSLHPSKGLLSNLPIHKQSILTALFPSWPGMYMKLSARKPAVSECPRPARIVKPPPPRSPRLGDLRSAARPIAKKTRR